MRRRRRGATDPGTPPTAPTTAAPAEEVDDLPGFFDHPPGSPAALAAAPAPAGPPPVPTGDVAPDPATPRGPRRRWVLAAGAVVVVVGAATAVALVSGDDHGPAPTGRPPADPDRTSAAPTRTAPSSSAAALTAAAAGDLADVDLPPGDEGFTAELGYTGVVLEPRAVGVTVAYPELTVSADGEHTIAHLELAVWNCLADAAPVDPAAADCRRSLTEYADLGSPDLQVTRTGGEIELTGTAATYTRPNGSPAAYTGRSYPLEIVITPTSDGATGTLGLGAGGGTAVPPGQLAD